MPNTKKGRALYLIARIGGWDGISIQSRFWIKILLLLKKRVSIITGEIDENPGPMGVEPYNKVKCVTLSEMSLESQSSLYINAYRDNYNRRQWLTGFLKKKDAILKKLEKYVEKNDIIIAHNFSIKHLVPASWAALYELASRHSNKRFVSIDADSPYERGFVLSNIDPEVMWILSNPEIWEGKNETEIEESLLSLRDKKIRALPGPIPLPNMFHISFNNYQSRVVKDIYGVSPENVLVIPDIGEFKDISKIRKISDRTLLKLIKDSQVVNPVERISKRDVFIISPVRPVYRKNLKLVAYLSHQFGIYLKEQKNKKVNVFLIITHPSKDEDSYWQELQEYAKGMNINLVHLGEKLKLRRRGKREILYEEFLTSMSRMNSISVIGSSVGAWENGIVESTESMIPVSVNPLLPAYQDMVMMGFQYIPCPITRASKATEGTGNEKAWMLDPSIEKFFESVYEIIFNKEKRQQVIKHNFETGKKNMSINAVLSRVKKIIM